MKRKRETFLRNMCYFSIYGKGDIMNKATNKTKLTFFSASTLSWPSVLPYSVMKITRLVWKCVDHAEWLLLGYINEG